MRVDLSKFFSHGEKVAVAVSGGADSMALLHYLSHNAEGVEVSAVNVEHGIRGADSLSDSRFVSEYCSRNGIRLFSFSVDSRALAAEAHISLEQAARRLRYECFDKLLKQGKCDKIATAHHAGDNAETVLLNLFRGSSLKGAAGIKPVQGKITRPFIGVSKAEILDYVEENRIPFVIDASNSDVEITRNFVRHELLPRIKKFFPEAERALARFADNAREEDEYLDRLASELVEIDGDGIKIAFGERALMKRAAVTAMKRSGVCKDYESVHAEAVSSLATLENGAEYSLPGGLIAVREYDGVFLYRPEKSEFAPVPFAEGKFEFARGTLTIKRVPIPENLHDGFYADPAKIPAAAVLRTRRNGDVFTKFGGGTRKLKEFFIDEKIPARIRDDLPLIAVDSDVLFAAVAVSDKIKIDATSEKALKITYEKKFGGSTNA